ncbi:hypothetical protein SY83_01820 [Paenibacillus swuensis]|uniref:NlpC/P60 domain-containing protein n=2 Tax=Paenibacillus swuensis TaxID=1178515 RepID=A0A172TNQ6_9BACL|nr:hypothetical protein SY83_01820 [Paenibacillus swuensis]
MRQMTVAVSVATVWTTPESPRALDAPALARPAGIREWLSAMTIADRLDLCASNRVQTQALYGVTVRIAEEREQWVKVLLPQQSTRQHEAGYPGWVPRAQLAAAMVAPPGAAWAEVVAGTAWLYGAAEAVGGGGLPAEAQPQPRLELSYLTKLPVLEAAGDWVKVQTTEGTGFFKADDVRILTGSAEPVPGSSPNFHTGRTSPFSMEDMSGNSKPNATAGQTIVEQARRFLGLHYLWGGMSAFGYDCSGFAYNMHHSFGINIPRDASDQARHGLLVEKADLEAGDLLFFAHEEGKGRVHHVGIYAGDGRMIHAPESTSSIELVDLKGFRLEKEHCISRRYWS